MNLIRMCTEKKEGSSEITKNQNKNGNFNAAGSTFGDWCSGDIHFKNGNTKRYVP